MAISFEKIINLTTNEGNTAPKVVEQLSIIHEATKGELVQYYIDPKSKSEGDKNTYAIGIYDEKTKEYSYVDYDEVTWNKPKKRITSQKIDRLGLKAFPGIGAIAFYKLAYRNASRILAPVNIKGTKYTAPTLSYVVNSDNSITFTITPPKDITYQCYRIILALDMNQLEYVTYETTITIPQVVCSGNYTVYCIGYLHEGAICSIESNSFEVALTGTQDTWPTVTPGTEEISKLSDLSDVSISEPIKDQILQYNTEQSKWNNKEANFATTQQLTEAIQQAINDSWEASY